MRVLPRSTLPDTTFPCTSTFRAVAAVRGAAQEVGAGVGHCVGWLLQGLAGVDGVRDVDGGLLAGQGGHVLDASDPARALADHYEAVDPAADRKSKRLNPSP